MARSRSLSIIETFTKNLIIANFKPTGHTEVFLECYNNRKAESLPSHQKHEQKGIVVSTLDIVQLFKEQGFFYNWLKVLEMSLPETMSTVMRCFIGIVKAWQVATLVLNYQQWIAGFPVASSRLYHNFSHLTSIYIQPWSTFNQYLLSNQNPKWW